MDAFDGPIQSPRSPHVPSAQSSGKRPIFSSQSRVTPQSNISPTYQKATSHLMTPVRSSSSQAQQPPPSTIRRTVGGTARKAGVTRALSEVEALKQMGDCVRASARKRLSEGTGRGSVAAPSTGSGVKRRSSWVRMTLDFENVGNDDDGDDGGKSGYGEDGGGGLRIFVKDRKVRPESVGSRKSGDFGSIRSLRSLELHPKEDQSLGDVLFGTGAPVPADDHTSDLSSTDEAPQSPSPSPRPQSAMSRPNSAFSRRVHNSHSAGTSSAGIAPNISSANVNPRPISFRRSTTPVATMVPNVQSFAQPSASSSKLASQPTPAQSIFSTSKPPSTYEQRIVTQDIPPLDPDATPKPKRPPSSSAPPIFVPPAPIFTKNPPSAQPKPRDFAFNPEEDARPASMNSSALRGVVANPRTNVTRASSDFRSSAPVVQPSFGSTQSDELADMQERLKKMMNDIDNVSDQIQKVKMRLK
jgi:hypothetical protein